MLKAVCDFPVKVIDIAKRIYNNDNNNNKGAVLNLYNSNPIISIQINKIKLQKARKLVLLLSYNKQRFIIFTMNNESYFI